MDGVTHTQKIPILMMKYPTKFGCSALNHVSMIREYIDMQINIQTSRQKEAAG